MVGISPTAPSLGDGFWSVQGTLLFIQQYDPVVLFYGLGMERSFPHEYVGIEFVPGAQYNYLMGVGFAVNERITLSTRFFGSYVEELEANGASHAGHEHRADDDSDVGDDFEAVQPAGGAVCRVRPERRFGEFEHRHHMDVLAGSQAFPSGRSVH